MSNDKYKPEYCKMLIDHMKMGLSYDSFPSKIYDKYEVYVGLSTMYDWEERLEDWKNAKSIAVSKSLMFYEQRASAKVSGQKIDGINTKDIDSYVLMGMLKTRFHKIYGDKARVEHDVAEDVKDSIKLFITKEENDL